MSELKYPGQEARKQSRRKSSFMRKSSSSTTTSKRVSFTEYSTVAIYEEEDGGCPARNRWYSCKDQYLFNAMADIEARRIRQVIDTYSLDMTSSIFSLLERRVLSTEELLGIEHKVDGFKRHSERRRHSSHLLDHKDELKDKKEDYATRLAAVAANSSSKSVELARFRAALAA